MYAGSHMGTKEKHINAAIIYLRRGYIMNGYQNLPGSGQFTCKRYKPEAHYGY
jgi:hypothetical protein